VSEAIAKLRATVGTHAAVALLLAFGAGWIISAVVR